MNWYRLEAVRDALRLDYGAQLAPSVIGKRPRNLEVWRRTIEGHTFVAFLNYEGDEFLVPEEALLAAADGLSIERPLELLASVRARGGLWTGPNP